ncbi:hypothetical protein AMTR_s00031p00232660 [Amborella trichopoda]|uniref:Uncharacterized protein n=1 Tax=Amborella trichopoda TaxID=13333 RepID=U5D5A3_AMBTC|nr:hypothetical protein AMTR_s00031p00232660 [Amborella trichopoda]
MVAVVGAARWMQWGESRLQRIELGGNGRRQRESERSLWGSGDDGKWQRWQAGWRREKGRWNWLRLIVAEAMKKKKGESSRGEATVEEGEGRKRWAASGNDEK